MDNPAAPISSIPSTSPQPAIQPAASSPAESPGRRWLLWLIGGLVFLVLGIAIGIFGAKFLSQPQTNQSISSPTPLPSEVPTPNADPTTFKFTDTEKVEAPVKNIVYKKTPGWSDFKSNTGYSLQVSPTFSDTDGSGEESRDGACFMFFGNNAGGIISAKVVPYSGGSRRELYGIQPGYDYSFEESLIQNKRSLIIEAGPIGDSGSGSGAVIPAGDHALIISWANRAKNSAEFNSLLQSITLQSSLDPNQCGK